jgi:hypothetical protein
MKPRISIAMILTAMVPLAVGFAALANPTAFWEGAIFLLTMVVMFAAVLGVCYRRKAERAFWVGFSLFGWGLFLVSWDLNLAIRPTTEMWSSFGAASEQGQLPFTALVRNLVDTLQLSRSAVPKSIGERVQVQWGSGASYYPSTVSDIKDGQYKIRYDSDQQGRWDEWVGMNRIKSDGLARCYRIAEMLFLLLFAIAGGVIGVYFCVTGRPSEPAAESSKSSGARADHPNAHSGPA